jgi:hypothetical protein
LHKLVSSVGLFLKGRYMKNREKLAPLVLALGLTLSAMAVLVGTAHAQAIVSSESGTGSVELSNTTGTGDPEPVASEPGKGEATANPAADAAVAAEAEPPKDTRELHRDRVMQMPEVMPAGTSAASRRYKKMDLSTYRALMQNNAVQPAQ